MYSIYLVQAEVIKKEKEISYFDLDLHTKQNNPNLKKQTLQSPMF